MNITLVVLFLIFLNYIIKIIIFCFMIRFGLMNRLRSAVYSTKIHLKSLTNKVGLYKLPISFQTYHHQLPIDFVIQILNFVCCWQ